jgi:hypothetical protein
MKFSTRFVFFLMAVTTLEATHSDDSTEVSDSLVVVCGIVC